MSDADFGEFLLAHLPPPPGDVLEIGCGYEGGFVSELVARGYEALGVDPDAPAGDRFVRATFQEARAALSARDWHVVVAGRVLHHVHPLEESLDQLVELAPLLIVDEFAPDLVIGSAQTWYEEQHRLLRAAGEDPSGPPDLDEWRTHHADLHPHHRLLEALRQRYDERALEWVPYFHRWLRSPASEQAERAAIDAGTIPAVGYRWVGTTSGGRLSTTPAA